MPALWGAAAGLSFPGRRKNGLLGRASYPKVRETGNISGYFTDTWQVQVIEHDHAANFQKALDIKEIEHHMFKRVKTINECDLEKFAISQQFWQRQA